MTSWLALRQLDATASAHRRLAHVRAVPLFADLADADLYQISTGLRREKLRSGQLLYRQGEEADSAFFVQRGRLSVASTLPGGEATHLADLGPGSMLGETTLVSAGMRSGCVRAETEVVGYSMERSFFRAALAQANPSASRILGRLIRIVCERLLTQQERIVSIPGQIPGAPCRNMADAQVPVKQATKASSFACQTYLPRLTFFSGFQSDEIEGFASLARRLELPRDTVLFEHNDTASSCYFVVRGALELCIARNGGTVPLAVLGPGAFLGTTEVIVPGRRIACGRVREDATVFELSAGNLHDLLSSRSRYAIKFQLAFCESLISDLGKVSKRFARIISQARQGGAGHGSYGLRLEALQIQ